MTQARTIQTLTIPLSASVSGPVPAGNARRAILFVPPLTSCQLLFEGSTVATSASFAPIWSVASQAPVFLNVGPGSLAAVLSDQLAGFEFVRLAASVPQAAVRSFTLVTM